MYNYPVLECLAAFAIVFLIGFLFAKSKVSSGIMAPQKAVALA